MTTVDLPPREHGARTSTSRPATLREHDDAVLAQAETSCRPPLARAVGAALLGGLLAGIAAPGRAQPPLATTAAMAMAADSARVDARPRVGPLAGAAATGGLILLGAAGAQAIRTPDAWPRTAAGFGKRAADQTGFYVLQTGTQRALAAGLGWHADEAPCPRRGVLALAGCAVARTFTAVDRSGARRPPVPFVASVAAATAASVAWRPERRSAAEAGAFVATRLAVVFAGYAGERLLVEWRRARAGGASDDAASRAR